MYKGRLGRLQKWYHTAPEDEAHMRIPDDITKSVCFVGIKLAGGENVGDFYPFATGFFVFVTQGNFIFNYLVIAKHSLDSAIKHTDTIYVRLNKKDGGVENRPINIKTRNWIAWENKGIDLAVIAYGIDQDRFDYLPIPIEMFATNEIINQQWIGLGDDVFVTGLFKGRIGEQKNIPIVRTGIISAMPDEPIKSGDDEFSVYLLELRSIGGISGSPVFVYLDRHRSVPTLLPQNMNSYFYFLGTIRGHWDLDKKKAEKQTTLSMDDMQVSSDAPLGYSKAETLNLGIALVTPAQDLYEMLMSPPFEEERNQKISKRKKEAPEVITEDSGLDGIMQKSEP